MIRDSHPIYVFPYALYAANLHCFKSGGKAWADSKDATHIVFSGFFKDQKNEREFLALVGEDCKLPDIVDSQKKCKPHHVKKFKDMGLAEISEQDNAYSVRQKIRGKCLADF